MLALFLFSLPIVSLAAVAPRASTTSVKFGGKTYVNKGLVGFGVIPATLRDSYGDTIGGIGSAIALKKGTFKKTTSGTFVGTLITQPDRGYNVETTIDYQSRRQIFDFVLTPYTSSSDLSYSNAIKTLTLKYTSTQLSYERNGTRTTGLDGLAVRAADSKYPLVALADPVLPIASKTYNHLSVDAEGLVVNADGSYWTSDEYGPYIYKFSANGSLITTIQPPAAFLPYIGGVLNFTSTVDPDTGRAANQGFEGLSLSADGRTLYALGQSALIQDGGNDDTTSRYTRLLAFDLGTETGSERGVLSGEWIIPLPQSKKSKTRAVSELFTLGNGIFLVLSRDGNGHGGDSTDASYKNADLVSITGATNIANTIFDDPKHPASPKGVLNSTITPASYAAFVDYTDETQLGRFGLQNGGDNDKTLIGAKWESFALAPALDSSTPDDYFLFTMQDNDFITVNGTYGFGTTPYSSAYGQDVDTQVFVWRLTLPGATVVV